MSISSRFFFLLFLFLGLCSTGCSAAENSSDNQGSTTTEITLSADTSNFSEATYKEIVETSAASQDGGIVARLKNDGNTLSLSAGDATNDEDPLTD